LNVTVVGLGWGFFFNLFFLVINFHFNIQPSYQATFHNVMSDTAHIMWCLQVKSVKLLLINEQEVFISSTGM